MKRKLTLTLTFFATACVLTGCSQDNHDNELPDIFISEYYSGEDADDCVVELGTSSKEEWSLEGIKVNKTLNPSSSVTSLRYFLPSLA